MKNQDQITTEPTLDLEINLKGKRRNLQLMNSLTNQDSQDSIQSSTNNIDLTFDSCSSPTKIIK